MIAGLSKPKAESTRVRIVDEADRLFYEQGFEATSFGDIAEAVNLSRGNFYYHFKTKDDILDAVIARRIESTRAMLDQWEHDSPSPADRVLSFARILITNRSKIMTSGCPVGTLCNELAKLDHHAQMAASSIFALFRDWLADHFAALGHGDNADDLAMHLLMRSQGVATLATAFRDPAFVDREVAHIEQWVSTLASNAAIQETSCLSSR